MLKLMIATIATKIKDNQYIAHITVRELKKIK